MHPPPCCHVFLPRPAHTCPPNPQAQSNRLAAHKDHLAHYSTPAGPPALAPCTARHPHPTSAAHLVDGVRPRHRLLRHNNGIKLGVHSAQRRLLHPRHATLRSKPAWRPTSAPAATRACAPLLAGCAAASTAIAPATRPPHLGVGEGPRHHGGLRVDHLHVSHRRRLPLRIPLQQRPVLLRGQQRVGCGQTRGTGACACRA